MPTVDTLELVTLREFGAGMRGINRRFENLDGQWEIINKHSDILKKQSDILKRVADNEAGLHPHVRSLILKNKELETALEKAEARLVKMEGAILALQQATSPLRPRAVKAEADPHPPCP